MLIDLDDPTVFIGRIIRSLSALLQQPGYQHIAIDVYACSESDSASVKKKVAKQKVVFLRKPLTRESCLVFATKYPPRVLIEEADSNSLL